MKRWAVSLFAVLLALVLAVPAMAEEDIAEPSLEPITVEAEADDKNIVVNVTLPAMPAASPAPTIESEPMEVDNTPAYMPYSVSSLDEAPPPGDTLADTVTALFGNYTPRTQTITDYLADGTAVTYQQVIPGVAGLDWPWLSSVGLFSLFLYGLLRMIGGLLKL